jgi:hypothetical protein
MKLRTLTRPAPKDVKETAVTEVILPDVIAKRAARRRRRRSQLGSARRMVSLVFDPDSPALTYTGVVVVAVGFALIGLAWARVAALLNVGLQMPYVVSAGFVGLALVMVGLVLVNLAARRRDAATRTRQLDRLTSILGDLQRDLTAGTDADG